MNPITWQLVKKDWHFNKLPMFGYAILGAVALALINLASGTSFLIGSILLITVVVTVGIHLVFVTVIYERSKQTLPMIMSLPITFMQYTRAKMIANIGVFTLAWLILVAGAVSIILSHEVIPDGMLPFSLIVLGELFVANILILAVAMISESEAWTIVVMAICNVCISIFMFFIKSFPAIGDHVAGPAAVWNNTVTTAIALEAIAVVALIALTFFAQSRKNDYL